jgi:hypothetical protein
MEIKVLTGKTNWSLLANVSRVILWHLHVAAIVLSFFFFSSCEHKTGKILESDAHVMIEMTNYRLLVQKEGFRFGFQDLEDHIIVPAHAQSGLQVGPSSEKLVDALSCTYSGHNGHSHTFSVKMDDGSSCRVEIRLMEHMAQFSAFPEKEDEYSIVSRAGPVSPGYGLGDDLITDVCPGWSASVIKGRGTEITGFTDDDFRAKGVRERMISNFAIYPVNKFAWVNIEPNSKIVRSTKEEIAQGSNDVASLDQLYFFFGDTKQIYSSWLQIRNKVGYPVMKPEYELFGVGWEAWGHWPGIRTSSQYTKMSITTLIWAIRSSG